jgi:hypothetical protein
METPYLHQLESHHPSQSRGEGECHQLRGHVDPSPQHRMLPCDELTRKNKNQKQFQTTKKCRHPSVHRSIPSGQSQQFRIGEYHSLPILCSRSTGKTDQLGYLTIVSYRMSREPTDTRASNPASPTKLANIKWPLERHETPA